MPPEANTHTRRPLQIRAFVAMMCLLESSDAFMMTPRTGSVHVSSGASSGVGMALLSGEMVEVISGDDKGKVGKVLRIEKKKNLVVVEGVNVRTKHVKPMKEGQQGSSMCT